MKYDIKLIEELIRFFSRVYGKNKFYIHDQVELSKECDSYMEIIDKNIDFSSFGEDRKKLIIAFTVVKEYMSYVSGLNQSIGYATFIEPSPSKERRTQFKNMMSEIVDLLKKRRKEIKSIHE